MQRLIYILLSLAPLMVGAQTIEGGDIPPIKPVKKTVYDSARVKVYYEYDYRPDSTKADNWRHAQTVLLIGSEYSGFADYYSLKADSLNDAYYYAKRKPMELLVPCMSVMRNINYKYPLAIDMTRNTATVQLPGFINCEYTQQLEPLAWTLAEGDSTIAGVHCRKATCRMGGRDWVAWYSVDYSIPQGPYLFSGLPGLIFAVRDTKNNHVFTLNGLETLPKPELIYLKSYDKKLKLSRKDALKAKRNEYEDPQTAIEMSGKHIWTEDGSRLPSSPYNPIELE